MQKRSIVNLISKCTFIVSCFTLLVPLPLFAIRKRKPTPELPTIEAFWQNEPTHHYRISSNHLCEYPTFGWHFSSFNRYLVPPEGLSYTNGPDEKQISRDMLNEVIEKTLKEISDKKKKLTHAVVLQNKNFNRRKKCGLLVLRLKEYPFVIKLFKETPQSFVNPYCKGIEPICFFYMGNGANRHIAGLTRLKNRDLVAQKIKQLDEWKDRVEVPRKWLWLPKDPDWITINGTHFGPENKALTNSLPGTYAIIADAIDTTKTPNLSVRKRKGIVMQLCNSLDSLIDPHFKNFIFSQPKSDDICKIIIIDTEHFPTMIGLQEHVQFKNHSEYIMFLISKCFHDAFLQSKPDPNTYAKQKSEFLNELFGTTL